MFVKVGSDFNQKVPAKAGGVNKKFPLQEIFLLNAVYNSIIVFVHDSLSNI